MLNFRGWYWPQGWKKKIPSNLGGQFATLGANVSAFINYPDVNVLAFIRNLGQTTSQKCSKLAPNFFGSDS
jgi:hypothetical protein